jgi:hypothetical protein
VFEDEAGMDKIEDALGEGISRDVMLAYVDIRLV